MPYLELSIALRAEQQPRVEAALDDLGALCITLLDAADQPIFEPAPGETPLWAEITLNALFEAETDKRGLVHALAELVPELTPDHIGLHEVADQDWTRVWMDQYQPMRFGRRLWIYPWNIQPPEGSDDVVVRLDPGLAFGTGTHPTTALCLEWLDGTDLDGQTVVDFGCGSGVLAIAALKLGAAKVIGVDNDPQAIDASLANAQRNAVDARLELCLPDAFQAAPVAVLVANILAGPLGDLAALFARAVRPGGRIALSGILAGQETELLRIYAEWFEDLKTVQREDWMLISGTRKQ